MTRATLPCLLLLLTGTLLASGCSKPERPAPTVPGAPARAEVTPGPRSLAVAWEPPAASGNEHITGYVVTASPAGVTVEVGRDARSAVLTPVSSTQAQRVTVAARSAAGKGPATSAPGWIHAQPEPATLTSLDVSLTENGCGEVRYGLRQVDGARADIVVEVDADGDGTFTRATQAGSATHSGLIALATSPDEAGAPHAFLWNRTLDVPGAASLQVRVTATVPGTRPSVLTVPVALPVMTRLCEWEYAPFPWSETGAEGRPAHGDFDRDGKQDLLVLSTRYISSGTPPKPLVSLVRGLGNGRFADPRPALGEHALKGRSVATADLDRDGVLDLVILDFDLSLGDTSTGPLTLHVALGQGDGTFAPPTPTRLTPPAPLGRYEARPPLFHDLDGDGAPEVVVLQAGTLYVLSHTGGGQLAVAFTHDLGARALAVVGDFNADDHPDVLAVGESLLAFRGQGQLAFTPEPLGPMEGIIHDAVTADFNRDGLLDLVTGVVGATQTELYLRLGNREGGFSDSVHLATPYGSSHLSGVFLFAQDVDADGLVDLAYTHPRSTDFTVLRGLGDGTFKEPWSIPVGQYLFIVMVDDVDGSGRPDAVLSTGSRVNTLRDLQEPTSPTVGLRAVTADFDGDGWDDVASLAGGGGVQVLLTRAEGGWVRKGPFAAPPKPSKLIPGRFDADATVDLLVHANALNGVASLVLLRGQGDGSFAPPEAVEAGAEPWHAATGDLDADGDLDVVSITWQRQNNYPVNRQLRLLRNRGDGTFAVEVASVDVTRLSGVGLALGDLNQDGRADVVMMSDSSVMNVPGYIPRYELSWFESQADGTLKDPTPRTEHWYCSAGRMLLDDIDSDGLLDVAVPCADWTYIRNSGRGGLDLLMGYGQASPPPPSPYTTYASWFSTTVDGVVARDLDGDGSKELVVALSGRNAICIQPSEVCVTSPISPSSVALVDLEHDGVLEFVVGGGDNGYSVILRQP
ncbi:FG-GAP-like repeat-containing protein [Pyxidicoccus sp. 3LFB2]